MNVATVGVLALLLAVPAVLGLAGGSIDPDEVGLRVLLMAVAVAVVAEIVLRRFVDAVRRPSSSRLSRREGDPPTA